MKYLCLLFACMILMGCQPRPEGLVRPDFYLVVEKILPNTVVVVVWTEEGKRVYRIVLSPEEYEQVHVGRTGLVPVIWVEGER